MAPPSEPHPEAAPAMTLAEATAALTAPGQGFEMETLTIRGVPTRTWKSAPATLRSVLELSALHGEQDFLVYEDERVSFAEHFRIAAGLAHTLVDRFGVRPGDRVAVAMRNLPEWVMAFWASIAAGAVVVPLNAWWTGAELAYGLNDSGTTVVFADEERRERILPHLDDIPDLRTMVVCCEDPDPGGGRRSAQGSVAERPDGDPVPVIPFGDLTADRPGPGTLPEVAIDPDDDATIFYTSGTTGRPKGAVGTHRNSVSNLMNLFFVSTVGSLRRSGPVADVTSGGQNANLLSVPLFHATGCHAVLVTNTAAGGKLVMMHHFDPERALELIERERITIFGGVPAMVMQVIDSPNFAKRDTSSVKSISYGGAPCPPDLVRRIKEHFPGGAPGQRLRPDRDLGHDHHERRRRLRPQARQRGAAGSGVRRGRGARGVRGRGTADRPARRSRADRRVVDQGTQRGAGLLEPARGDRPLLHPGVAPHRRRGPHRRGGVRPHRGPGQGHDHPRWRERLLRRGGGGALRAPGGGRLRRHRRAPPGPRRGGRGRGACSGPARTSTPTSWPASWASGWPPSTCLPASGSGPTRCLATRPARS